MKSHSELCDSEFIAQFSLGQLPPVLFNHEAHLRLAWIHIRNLGEFQAVLKVCEQIQNYVGSIGEEDVYHVTLTVAAVKIVSNFMQKSVAIDFSSFIKENPRLNSNFKDLVRSHYSFDIYKSIEARRIYIEPDLLPFM